MIYPSLTQRLKEQHKTIAALIIKLNNRQIQREVVKEKWSIHENIAHLAKYQPVFLDRIHKILTIDQPVFAAYRAEDDDEFEIYCAFTPYELLKKISRDRETIFQLITHLPADKLELMGIHPKYGKLTVLEWTEFFLLHEAHHLYTIFQLVHTT
ncbi:MAG TPA: DinB family protein [Mucilaginibacter sp.]|jgi:hypothetical protein|nr:DinB family protein [Mucilaginibacter sp.]